LLDKLLLASLIVSSFGVVWLSRRVLTTIIG
jgi:hypothetical protein